MKSNVRVKSTYRFYSCCCIRENSEAAADKIMENMIPYEETIESFALERWLDALGRNAIMRNLEPNGERFPSAKCSTDWRK